MKIELDEPSAWIMLAIIVATAIVIAIGISAWKDYQHDMIIEGYIKSGKDPIEISCLDNPSAPSCLLIAAQRGQKK